MLKVPQINDGDKIILSQKNDFRMLQKCCDCGSLHIWEFEIVDNTIHLKIARTNEKDLEENYEQCRPDFVRNGKELDPVGMPHI